MQVADTATQPSESNWIDITRVRPLNNYVLVEVIPTTDLVKTESGVTLYMYKDTMSDEKYKHAPTEAIVRRCPEQLRFIQGEDFSVTMPWKTDMELKLNDVVIISYLAYENAIDRKDGNKGYLEQDGKIYLFVKYEHIYLAKRKSKTPYLTACQYTEKEIKVNQIVIDHEAKEVFGVIMLNGNILVEPKVDAGFKSDYLIVPDSLKQKKSEVRGIIHFIGSKNQAYHRDYYGPLGGDHDTLRVGDDVGLDYASHVPLQYDLHKIFPVDYYRVERPLVIAYYGNTL